MNVPAIVALAVLAAALGLLALYAARRSRWSHEGDRDGARRLKIALPVSNVNYVAAADVRAPLDLGQLSALRAFRERGETPTFTHPELARRSAELAAAITRFLDFVEARSEGDGDLRRFPASWETERPDEWRALVTRWIDVSGDVTICHEEFFRAARRVLHLRRPRDESDVLE